MSPRLAAVAPPSQEVVIERLRARVSELEGRHLDLVRPVPEVLAPLLPGGGLKPGAAYGVTSSSLLVSLLAGPSHEGSWCGLVGLPDLGVEAAGQAGVRLDRVVLVPSPGERWLSVVAALAAALPLVAVRPPAAVRPADADRLASRLREHSTTLLVVDAAWPGVEACFDWNEPSWSGLGDGWGHLSGRAVSIHVTSKRYPRAKSARAWLPGADGALTIAAEPASMSQDVSDAPPLRLVA